MLQPNDPTIAALARRIHRFVLVLERYKRQPGRREAYYVLLAIECLRDARIGDGVEAMKAAERVDAIPMTVSDMPGLHDDMTAADLRAALRSVIRGDGEQSPVADPGESLSAS